MRIVRAVTLFVLLAAPAAVGQPPVVGPPLPPAPPQPGWQPPPPVPRPPPFPWFVLLPSWVGAFVAVIVTQKQALAREEEEVVTAPADVPEFEYKIIRSPFGAFKKPDKFRAALDEEARVGWQLVEKLDDSRVRLRRPVSCRQQDAGSDQDPYRIQVRGGGTGGGLFVVLIVLGVLLLLGACGLVIALTVK